MKGDTKVIDALRIAVTNEWSATSQYQAHAAILKQMGYGKLAEYELATSLEEREHADLLLGRLAVFGAIPVTKTASLDCEFGQGMSAILSFDLRGEMTGIIHYASTITLCEQVKDYVTREILAEILGDEHRHAANIEARQAQIEAMGIENFLASLV